MYTDYKDFLSNELALIHEQGLYKSEKVITSPQRSNITITGGKKVLNMCANNYLGLAQHPEIKKAAVQGLEEWGFGMASVRFICGTQELHKKLEKALSEFLGTEDTILYSSCFDANAGLFETLLGEEDAIISDELNHASIIDGIRLCKAKRLRYKNNNPEDLEAKLKEAAGTRFKMIATDGVFSMDGYIAKLPEIAALAKKYNALLMIDDSHAVGFMGKQGRGTHEYHNIIKDVDVITGTLGKALGGASGGYVSGKKEIVDYLRQRSRTYLFSNSLAPSIAAAALKALELITKSTELRDTLEENTKFFRKGIESIGLEVLPGTHPIVPVMLGDAIRASKMADYLMEKGVFVRGFTFPVVPHGKARIRTQVSAAHTEEDLTFAIEMFKEAKSQIS